MRRSGWTGEQADRSVTETLYSILISSNFSLYLQYVGYGRSIMCDHQRPFSETLSALNPAPLRPPSVAQVSCQGQEHDDLEVSTVFKSFLTSSFAKDRLTEVWSLAHSSVHRKHVQQVLGLQDTKKWQESQEIPSSNLDSKFRGVFGNSF